MDKSKLDELARLHEYAMAEIHGPKNEQFVAECYRSFPGILAYVRELEGEKARAVADESRHWVDIIRRLDPENLCDYFDGLGNEEQLRQWLAARDAQQRREGAVMKLLDMSLGGFAWDETGLRREAEAMLLDAGQRERYEQLLAEAQRLREEGK